MMSGANEGTRRSDCWRKENIQRKRKGDKEQKRVGGTGTKEKRASLID